MSTLPEQSRPRKARWCTDIFCLVIFLFFWAILIFLAAFAFVIGNPFRLIYGLDSFGNVCGLRNEPLGSLSLSGRDMTDKQYVFYLNMTDINSVRICIKKCPDRLIENQVDLENFMAETGTKLCRYDFDNGKSFLYPLPANDSLEKAFQLIEEKSRYGPCPKFPVYPTKPILNRCVPRSLFNLSEDVAYSIYHYLNSIDTIQQTVSDLYASRLEMATMILLSLLLAVIMVLLIHFLAAVVSWIVMAIVAVSSVCVSAVLWWTYASIKWNLDSTPTFQFLEESVKNERAFLTYSIISTVLTVILLLIILVMRKRVQLVVALFKEAGNCIRSMPCLLVQPLWTFIALVLFFVFWIAVLLALATADYPVRKEETVQLDLQEGFLLEPPKQMTTKSTMNTTAMDVKAYTLVSYSESSWVRYMWWFHVVGLIWISEFILACQQMVIAGSVASWYFCRNRKQLRCPIGQSVLRLFLYHMGSLALGSFLITIFKVPRLILKYVESKLKKHGDSTVASCCLKCCTCCLCCFEKFLKYLNHNAYTVIAIRGVGFCEGAREAFTCLVSNALRVAAINSVGDFVLFLGKCGVTALTAFVGVLMMKHDPELHFYAIPVFLGTVFSFFIAHCVLSIYEMVIDTLFLCFCEDMRMNDGSVGKEYFAPPGLMVFFKGQDVGDIEQPLRELPVKYTSDESDGEQKSLS